jgi:Predicted transcriptional regulator containing an HTH domain and an uncharacterized domain shared with the mammalian protein Schlafen
VFLSERYCFLRVRSLHGPQGHAPTVNTSETASAVSECEDTLTPACYRRQPLPFISERTEISTIVKMSKIYVPASRFGTHMESQNEEWKESWKAEHLNTISAFANCDGGIIVIGKCDNGDIIGIQNPRKLLESIPNTAINKLDSVIWFRN